MATKKVKIVDLAKELGTSAEGAFSLVQALGIDARSGRLTVRPTRLGLFVFLGLLVTLVAPAITGSRRRPFAWIAAAQFCLLLADALMQIAQLLIGALQSLQFILDLPMRIHDVCQRPAEFLFEFLNDRQPVLNRCKPRRISLDPFRIVAQLSRHFLQHHFRLDGQTRQLSNRRVNLQ